MNQQKIWNQFYFGMEGVLIKDNMLKFNTYIKQTSSANV
jgi:hypothetical protein